MKYLKESVQNEIEIRKSKFITNLIPIKNIEEATLFLSEIKKEHYNATHNCFAYVIDKQMTQKMSDDGEPSRTAGFPILEALLSHNLDNVLCVVTRYFGGIHLGKGGLIRAYQNSALEAIKKASFYKEALKKIYLIEMPYAIYDSFNFYVSDKSNILEQHFSELVSVTLYLNGLTIEELYDQFNGQFRYTFKEEIIVEVPL